MKVVEVELKKIDQNENSRVVYKENDITELMQSIKKEGLLQPIGVRKTDDGYEAVWGNRRILAAKKLGWVTIPANVVDNADSENDRDFINLAENIKRQNTSVSEEGRLYLAMMDRGLKKEEIAARLDVSVTRIETATAVHATLPADLKRKVVNRVGGRKVPGTISATAAHQVLTLRKTFSLSRKQTRKLLEYSTNQGATTQHLAAVAPMMSAGMSLNQALSMSKKLDRVTLHLFMDRQLIEKLERKYDKSINQVILDHIDTSKEIKVTREVRGGYSARPSHANGAYRTA